MKRNVLLYSSAICAAALLCGCSETFHADVTELAAPSPTVITVNAAPAASSDPRSVFSSIPASEPETCETSCGAPSEAPSTGFLVKGLEQRLGKTGEELSYQGEWCALVLSDMIRGEGYDTPIAFDPCDLAVGLLNGGYADFYCLRRENLDSLIEYGLTNTDRVIMTSRGEFVPERGDMVCFLYDYDASRYNWSHIGVVAENGAEDGVLHTIEGNIGKGADPLFHSVMYNERAYDDTVVGFIRLSGRT